MGCRTWSVGFSGFGGDCGFGGEDNRGKGPFMQPRAGCLLSTCLMAVGAGHDHGLSCAWQASPL